MIASDTPRSGSRRESAAVPATGAVRATGRRLPARLRRRAALAAMAAALVAVSGGGDFALRTATAEDGTAAQVARTVPSDADPDGNAA